MGKINMLSTEISHLIAAGEVVGRPVSVVKELVENAIDAGATTISVEMKGGGVSYMKISDNGSGILKEDVAMCLKRHATSKIATKEDLYAIATLGFRGEALAAISSVCKLSIITCSKEEQIGTQGEFDGGNTVFIEDIGCPVGTTFVVRDLFFNTPARMKFLKRDATEAGYVSDMMERLALSNPRVAVRYMRDGKLVFATSGNGKIDDCIYTIYGKEFYSGLIPVAYEYSGMKLWGYISIPTSAKSNRTMQNFYLNGRYIKSKNLMFGLEEAYKDAIMTKRYPACVLYMEADCTLFDVNVHPEKTEVKFVKERDVYDMLYYGCKTALTKGDKKISGDHLLKKTAYVEVLDQTVPVQVNRMANAKVDYDEEGNQQTLKAIATFHEVARAYEQEGTAPMKTPAKEGVLHSGFSSYGPSGRTIMPDYGVNLDVPFIEKQEPVFYEKEKILAKEEVLVQNPLEDEGKKEVEKQPVADYKIIGELFKTYILVEQGDVILLIDKHAAHERILYEQLKKNPHEQTRQTMLEPIIETLTRSDVTTVLENSALFEKMGFEIEEFGDNSIVIRSLPLDFTNEDTRGILSELIGKINENKNKITLEVEDKMMHSMACKAAIKARQNNSMLEIHALVSTLFACSDIRYCPHGRPVSIEMTKYAIEKQFGRIV